MNIVKEDKSQQISVLKLTIGKEDYESGVNATLKDYQKKVKLDGFRPGKVPFGMVKKMYGNYVLVEEVNKLVSKSLSGYIKENNLNILGEPMPSETEQKDINWDKDAEFEFCYDIAVAPELDIKLSKKNKNDYYLIQVSDEQLNQQIEQLCSRYGSQMTVDETEGTEVVKGDLVQVDANGEVMENGHSKDDASMLLSMIRKEDKLEQFKGKKIGESIVFAPMDVLDNEVEVSSFLNVAKEQKELLDGTYKFSIAQILRFQKAELNQELFDKVFGEGEVTSEEELRAKIKADMQERFLVNSDYKLLADMKDKLVKANPMDLPEEFLKRWLLAINHDKKDVTPEKIEEEMPHFLEDVKWQLVKNKVVSDNNIEVTSEEMIEAAKGFARQQLQQFGMFNPPEEETEKWGMEILKNQDEARKLAETEIDKKLVAYIKETIKLTDKEVSLEEFNKLFE